MMRVTAASCLLLSSKLRYLFLLVSNQICFYRIFDRKRTYSVSLSCGRTAIETVTYSEHSTWSRDSGMDVMIKLGSGRSEIRFPAEIRNFSLFRNFEIG